MRNKKWVRLLAYVTGSVNQELLLRNEYLAAENRVLRAKLPARLRLSDPERATLAEIGKRLGRKALREVAQSRSRTRAVVAICYSSSCSSILLAGRPFEFFYYTGSDFSGHASQ